MSNDIVVTKEQLASIMKKQTKKRLQTDVNKAMDAISASLTNVSFAFVSSKLEEIKNAMVEEFKKEQDSIILESKNKEKVELGIKKYLNSFAEKIKTTISNERRFSILNVFTVESECMTSYYDPSRHSLVFNFKDMSLTGKKNDLMAFTLYISNKNKKNEVVWDSLKVHIDKKVAKGLHEIIESNKVFLIKSINTQDFERIMNLNIALSEFRHKNNVAIHHHCIRDFFELKDFHDEDELRSALLGFKDEALLVYDIDLKV